MPQPPQPPATPPGVTPWCRFAVIVHDVAPPFSRQLDALLASLGPRAEGKLMAAVVPWWGGRWRIDAGFARRVAARCGEILQHGCTHRRDAPGLVSALTGRADELGGRAADAARRRVGLGREILALELGAAAAGFVAPAWQLGHLRLADLTGLGFGYLAGFGALRRPGAAPVSLATWSWDWGVVPGLGRGGAAAGGVLARLRPGALPCVVAHPLDVDRGHLPHILRVVDRLLAAGRTPATFAEVLGLPALGATP